MYHSILVLLQLQTDSCCQKKTNKQKKNVLGRLFKTKTLDLKLPKFAEIKRSSEIFKFLCPLVLAPQTFQVFRSSRHLYMFTPSSSPLPPLEEPDQTLSPL